MPDAEAEHEAPAREELERRGLLGHGGGLAQGELEHAGARASGRLVAAAATASVVSASPMGWGQKRWSTAHRESAPVASARRQSSASSGGAPGSTLRYYRRLERSSPCVVAGRINPRDGRCAPLPTGVTPT